MDSANSKAPMLAGVINMLSNLSVDNEIELKTSISGSFKFKPEIDTMHEHFADYGVLVLAPDLGWLYRPRLAVVHQPIESFRPLISEVGMSPEEVEERFLRAVDASDFLYLMNVEGYIGQMTSFELGYALGTSKPIYALEQIDYRSLAALEYNLEHFNVLKSVIKVMPIANIIADLKSQSR